MAKLVDPSLQGVGRLLQDAAPEEPVYVSRPRELEAAILQGRRHIVITAHLDMTSMPLRSTSICPDGCESPLPEIRETVSIRGNCTAPPTDVEIAVLRETPDAVALLPLTPGQCLIMSHDDLFPTLSYRMWLDNLYLRAVFHNTDNPVRDGHYIGLAGMPPLKWPLWGQGARYVTRVTIQGDGVGPTMGIWADENVYAQNCTFANLGGNGFEGCDVCSSAVIAANATVAVVNSTFLDPLPANGSTYVRAWGGGKVLLSGCTFARTPDLRLAPFYAYDNATIFSADADIDVRTDAAGTLAPPSPPSAIPTAPRGSHAAFLQRDDAWFVNTLAQQNVEMPPQPSYQPPSGPVPRLDFPDLDTQGPSAAGAAADADADDASGDDGDLSTAAVVGIVIVAALMLCAIAVVFVLYRVRRRQQRVASKSPLGAPWPAAPAAPPSSAAARQPSSTAGGSAMWDKGSIKAASSLSAFDSVPSHAGVVPSSGAASIDRPTSGHRDPSAPLHIISDGSTPAGSSLSAALASGTSMAAQVKLVQAQLDAISPQQVLLGRFRLLGPSERRVGGRSVIAFATGIHDKLAYAMKFFVVRAAFDAEVALHSRGVLGDLAPKVDAVYDPDTAPGALTDRFGRTLPPCIVMERGESLNEWSQRARPDVFQTVAVLAHVATQLRDMHNAGFVHCDVKPSNIMLLPRENRWTVVDFQSAARVGEEAPLAFTLRYAAPELAAAAGAGATTAAASPAADAWALGIVAFQLLTGKEALGSASDGDDVVQAQLRGEAPLPWEGSGLRSETRRKLGVFREPVLALLRRDPVDRASLRDFCDTCNDIVTSSTTMVGHA